MLYSKKKKIMDKTVQQIVNEKKYPIKVGSKNVPLEFGKLNSRTIISKPEMFTIS